MDRRHFLTAAAATLPALAYTSAAENTAADTLTQKAKMAMLATQRASWEQGVATQALIELGDDDLVILMASDAVLRQNKDGRFALMGSENNVTDPGSNGPGVLAAYKLTGDEKFKKAADAACNYYKNIAPRARNGAICHLTNSRQLWSDSMFMAPPFIAMAGDCDEAVKQVDAYRQALFSDDKKLFSHMWDDRENRFIRKDFWGGGNGWSAVALAQIIEVIPESKKLQRTRLIRYAEQLLDGCIAHMRGDGLFHDVIDDPKTFVETNLSQMLAYAIFKGIRAGWLDRAYLPAADRMRNAALKKIDALGRVRDACGSPTFNRPGTSTEAQAFFIMMQAAHRKLRSEHTL